MKTFKTKDSYEKLYNIIIAATKINLNYGIDHFLATHNNSKTAKTKNPKITLKLKAEKPGFYVHYNFRIATLTKGWGKFRTHLLLVEGNDGFRSDSASDDVGAAVTEKKIFDAVKTKNFHSFKDATLKTNHNFLKPRRVRVLFLTCL